MTTRVQENFPVHRFDVLSHPTQDDYERAKDKARQLLRQVLPEKSWNELEEKGTIQYTGKRGTCLQLSVPAPTYDRMVAEYLLIRNAEDVYWKTANIFSRSGNEFGIAALFLIAFDIALFVNLLLEVISVR
jgi:hypothetical protein